MYEGYSGVESVWKKRKGRGRGKLIRHEIVTRRRKRRLVGWLVGRESSGENPVSARVKRRRRRRRLA